MTDLRKSLRTNGLLLKSIPMKDRTEELCKIAVQQAPKALDYVPTKWQSESLCKEALKKDPSVFCLIKEKALSESLCRYAVKQDFLLLSKMEERYRTPKVCRAALNNSIEALQFVPSYLINTVCQKNNEKLVLSCLSWIQKDILASIYLPLCVREDHRILDYQKAQGFLSVIRSYYLPKKQLFCVDIKTSDDFSNVRYRTKAEYSSFDEYYHFLDGNLSGAMLQQCPFDEIDLHKYNTMGAVINSDVLARQGLYNDSYYMQKVELADTPNSPIENNEIALPKHLYYPSPVFDDGHIRFDINKIPVFYISDIHLGHRVKKHFPKRATREEVHAFIQIIAQKMVSSIGLLPLNSFLLIAGDTSGVFEFSEVFYTELVKHWVPERIVVVSGNHELWDPVAGMTDNINFQRSFFKKIGISFLQNEVLCVKDDFLDVNQNTKTNASTSILSETQILAMTAEELQVYTCSCPLLILGGIGFSGLNEMYNAGNLKYGYGFDSLSKDKAREKEITESETFATIHRKLMNCLGKNRVIVLTHMPKNDWDYEPCNPYWVYVNGHNHRNYFETNEARRIYADNQIGYHTEKIGLKYFYLESDYDIFINYPDGKHIIRLDQYQDFNRGKRINTNLSNIDGVIYMLKKNGVYMFLFLGKYSPNAKTSNLYLLDGGNKRKLNGISEGDIEYYYEKIDDYVSNITCLLDRYTGVQERISLFIRSLGGSGKIHGCIIDVDMPIGFGGYSYTHIFVNPIDGTITPYYARDVSSRIVYKDFKSLLEHNSQCECLLYNYKLLEEKNTLSLPPLRYGTGIAEWGCDDSVYDEGGYLYQMSRIIKSLQYCTEKNVIRIWNENLLNHELVRRIMISAKANDVINNALVLVDN